MPGKGEVRETVDQMMAALENCWRPAHALLQLMQRCAEHPGSPGGQWDALAAFCRNSLDALRDPSKEVRDGEGL